jgi:hypothetical protein
MHELTVNVTYDIPCKTAKHAQIQLPVLPPAPVYPVAPIGPAMPVLPTGPTGPKGPVSPTGPRTPVNCQPSKDLRLSIIYRQSFKNQSTINFIWCAY